MPQAMGPSPPSREVAAAISPLDHLTKATQGEGLASQTPVAQEKLLGGRDGATAVNIGPKRARNMSWQRELAAPGAFNGGHVQATSPPVDVATLKRRYLSGAQAQFQQTVDDGMVAQPTGIVARECCEQLLALLL